MINPQEFFSIKPEHDVLHVDMKGSWNPDITHEYVAEYKRLVHRYFAREWVAVINIQALDMLVSEQFQIESLKAVNTWSFIKGMKAMVVLASEANRSHLLYQFEEIYKDKQSFEKAFCFSQEEVNSWLVDQGFRVEQHETARKIA